MSDITLGDTRAPDRAFTLFRTVALVEGITTLALFLVAMPVKYALGYAMLVQIMGPVHGLAFLAYVMLLPVTFAERGWGAAAMVRLVLAACLPFGTFLNDPWLRRRHAAGA